MTKSEALDILDRFKDWNYNQKSISLAFDGVKTSADLIYDARRELILKAYNVLNDKEVK